MASAYRYALMEERLGLVAVLDAPLKGCEAVCDRMPSLVELKAQGGPGWTACTRTRWPRP